MLNEIVLRGTILTDLEEVSGKLSDKFLQFKLQSRRLSKTTDNIVVYIPISAGGLNLLNVGTRIDLVGVIRTRTHPNTDNFSQAKQTTSKRKLEVFVECKKFTLVNDQQDDYNNVKLLGKLYKNPIHRQTCKGRFITELALEVKIDKFKHASVPCVCWGHNSKLTANLPIDTVLEVEGRLQSREYLKRFQDGSEEIRIAYEVSISKINSITEDEE